MKIPVYNQQVNPVGLPGVHQNVNTRPSDFVDPQVLALAGTVTQLGNQAQGDFLRYSRERQALQEQVAREADSFRIQDAIRKFKDKALDRQYGEQGWARKTGADVFQPDESGRSLSDNVLTDMNKYRDEIALSLGNDRQRQQFIADADNLTLQIKGHLLNHEADQYRVYQRGVLNSSMDTEAKNIGLNYNDFNLVQQSLAKIDDFGSRIGKLEGAGEDAGKIHAQDIASKALRSGVNAALQHGNTEAALAILHQFGGRFDADTKTNVQNAITDSWGASQVKANPAGLKVMLDGSLSNSGTTGSIIDAIMKQESGGRDYNKDGSPLVSFDGKSSFSLQVTDKTASDPGFGIAPAKSRTAAEYNRVGRELISVYRDRYDGDPAKIAAAYNAGAGAVDTAIERGGDSWQDFTPKMTRETYIPAVLKNLGNSGNQPKTDNPYISIMSNQDRRKWANAADSEISKNQSIFAASLKKTITNQDAQAAATGQPGDMISEAQFQKAYDPDKAAAEYEDYRQKISFAQQLYSLNSMPTSQAIESINASKPLLGDTDYADKGKHYLQMLDALIQINASRKSDPIVFAQQSGYPIQSVNWNNPAQASKELSNRHAIAMEMSDKYQTPYMPLSKSEITNLTAVLNDGSESDKVSALKSIATGINDKQAYNAVLQQIRPDSPATSVAGQMIGMQHEDVARAIMRGEHYLNPSKGENKENGKGLGVRLPEDLNEKIYEKLGDALNGRTKAEEATISAVRAYYASKTYMKDNKFVDDDSFDEAIKSVVGDITEHADKQVIPPYGMDQTTFLDQAKQRLSREVGGDKKVLSQFDDMPMMSTTDGAYVFYRGLKPLVYNGKVIEIDFNQELSPEIKPEETKVNYTPESIDKSNRFSNGGIKFGFGNNSL